MPYKFSLNLITNTKHIENIRFQEQKSMEGNAD